MEYIGMFYFSGTGNTELVAEMIRKKFEELGCRVDLLRMEDIMKVGLHADPDQYDYLGIGCPVIGFGVPRLASEFIRDLPAAAGKKTFIFRTAGGVAPVNYHASKPIIKNLAGKGYEVVYERIFAISSNWMTKFDNEIVRKLYQATESKAGIMCEEIYNGKQRILKTGTGMRFMMGLVRTMASGILRFTGKDLAAGPACSRCGLCIKNCPAGNIRQERNKIRFGFSCSSCMRCVYACPNQAIHFRLFKFFPVQGGYQLEDVLNSPCESVLEKASPGAGLDITEEELMGLRIPPFFFDYIQNRDL